MNKKTFIMALCMVGHSGYAAPKRTKKAELKEEMVLTKQEKAEQKKAEKRGISLLHINWVDDLKQLEQQLERQQGVDKEYWMSEFRQWGPEMKRWLKKQKEGPGVNRVRQWLEEEKEEMVLTKQKNLKQQYPQQYQQYEAEKNDFMQKVQMYRDRIAELADWSKKLQSLTKTMENCYAPWISRAQEQLLGNWWKNQEQEMQKVVDRCTQAQQNYHSSLEDLKKKFNYYFEGDNYLKNFLNVLNQENNKINTFNDDKNKFYDNKRKLEETLNAIREQARKQQYQMRKNDLMKKDKMYWDRIAELDTLNGELQSLTKEMEDYVTGSAGGEERQQLLDRATEQEQKVQQVVGKCKQAEHSYVASLEDLEKNFNDNFEGDADLQGVVNALDQSVHKMDTFNGNNKKFKENMRRLEETLKATWKQKRPQEEVSENLDKKAHESFLEEEAKK